MEIVELLNNKNIKSKDKSKILATRLLQSSIMLEDILNLFPKLSAKEKATSLEAIEYSSKERPEIVNSNSFNKIVANLKEKAPRVKWESAKIIGNTAHLFPLQLESACDYLLDNTTHPGTVVRWSTAYALSNILLIKTPWQEELYQALKATFNSEEKESIKKIYMKAFKSFEKS